MVWSHKTTYDSLVNDPRFSNSPQNYDNPYACITPDQTAGKMHSMILYSPKSKNRGLEGRWYCYDDRRDSFDHKLHSTLKGFIEVKRHETHQGKNWRWCKVVDWDKFAKAIKLEEVYVIRRNPGSKVNYQIPV